MVHSPSDLATICVFDILSISKANNVSTYNCDKKSDEGTESTMLLNSGNPQSLSDPEVLNFKEENEDEYTSDSDAEAYNSDKDEDELETSFRRNRLPSTCESEDSFIVFEASEDEDGEVTDEETDDSEDEENVPDENQYEIKKRKLMDDMEVENSVDEVDFCNSSLPLVKTNHKKMVRFASKEKLCKVHPIIAWSSAYQLARKGPWEMYARDRCRFKTRIDRVESDIKHIFDPEHRAKIFKERFECTNEV